MLTQHFEAGAASGLPHTIVLKGEFDMAWQTPQAIEWRFGFEITMYIANR